MEEERKMYKVLVRKSEERDHSEDRGIDRRMGLDETGFEGVEWIYLAEDRDGGGLL
jgi:hypothetical protein